ncbi:hypothetical protein LCGC14_1479000 [marine sediment metagenome]|uniref:Uncharacterized protein n=1 Tax=marine sediment metagenome TaxID=412755 RepID=A0A0F9JA33_9ZZZZ
MKSPYCKCGNQRAKGDRRCLECKSAQMRRWRKTHPMTPIQRLKDICRSYANTYYQRGKIKKNPCEICNNPNSQMHHEDYSKPLDILWFCRPCHIAYEKI